MAWVNPSNRSTGDVITAAIWNQDVVANPTALSTHVHTGAAGDGGSSLGPLVKGDFTDASAPAAPGAGKTRVYAVSGRLRSRAGASGADSQLVSSLDGTTHGDILYFDGTSWVRLAPGTSGFFLKALGSGSAPSWVTLPAIAVIAETVLGADTANVDFTSIPATYRHLLIVVHGRSTDAAARTVDLCIRFNNDSATTYLSQYVQGNDATASAAGASATYGVIGHIMSANGTANRFGTADILISHYADTSFQKAATGRSGTYDSASELGKVRSSMCHWPATAAAINRVTLFPASGNFAAGTAVTLYGLPAA